MNATEGLEAGHAFGILGDPKNKGLQQLWSADGGTRCALEADGNLAIYRGSKLWESNTRGMGIVRAFMQASGDLTLLDASNRVRWHTKTAGNPAAYVLLQNDSNLVVYKRGSTPGGAGVLWSTGTGGGHGFDAALGHAVGGAVNAVTGVVQGAGDLLGDIPIVGKGIEAYYDLTVAGPFNVAHDIASGKRLDRVALDNLAHQVSDVREIAPYAQIVLSNVPGVGTGLSAAIGAGLALASGQTIDQALLAGVRGALPGQPLSGQVFDVASSITRSAVNGEPVTAALLDGVTAALPVSDAAKKAIHGGLELAAHVVSGDKIQAAWLVTPALNELRGLLPADTRKAFDAARALGDGQGVADIAVKYAGASLPKAAQNALQAGLTLGHAQGLQASAAHIASVTSRRIRIALPLRGVPRKVAPPVAVKRAVHISLGPADSNVEASTLATAVYWASGQKIDIKAGDPSLSGQVAAFRTHGVPAETFGHLPPQAQNAIKLAGFPIHVAFPKAPATGHGGAIAFGALLLGSATIIGLSRK